MSKTIAVMTGGGDAPGLNAVIRAVVKRGVSEKGWKVLGLEDSFDGLMDSPQRVRPLTNEDTRGILRLGGTILGTTNRGDPFNLRGGEDKSLDVADALRALGIEGMIAIGGDGTLAICYRLMQTRGIPVIGVPKTIDNDVPHTEMTFGFDTAMSYACDAVDRLHSTAESHERVMVLEVMGRDAGHLALHAALSGGADVCLIPEIPWRVDSVLSKLHARRKMGRLFSIIVVAEGAKPEGSQSFYSAQPGSDVLRLGGIGRFVAEEITEGSGLETRYQVLGHLQRGGSPSPFDRILATRLGSAAIEMAERGEWGRMVSILDGKVASVPLEDVGTAPARGVDPEGDIVRTARGVGITFGDEPS